MFSEFICVNTYWVLRSRIPMWQKPSIGREGRLTLWGLAWEETPET